MLGENHVSKTTTYSRLLNKYEGWNNCVGWQFFVLLAELFPIFSKISKHTGWKIHEIRVYRLEFFQKIIRLAAELFGRPEYLKHTQLMGILLLTVLEITKVIKSLDQIL